MSSSSWHGIALLLACILTFNAHSVDGLYTRKGPVSLLTSKTFDKAVHQSPLPAVVEFYAPWCGHCKALSPAYTKVAESLQGIATVAAVDCDDQSNAPICQEYDIKGFPTIKIFPAHRPKASAKRKTKYPSDYNGPRTAKGISEALTAALPSTHVHKIKDSSSYNNFTTSSALPKVVLFTDKPRTSALYKSLSLRFQGRLAFAEVNSKVADIVALHGVTKFPTLYVMAGSSEQAEEYTGNFKAAELIAYLSKQAGDAPAADSAAEEEEAGSSSKGKKEKEEKEVMQVVRELNMTDYDALSEEEDAWLVAFYAGKGGAECSKDLREWNKVNFQLSGITLAGQINISQTPPRELKGLEEIGLDTKTLLAKPCSMQIMLLPFGEKDEPVLYKGNVTTKELQTFAMATFPDIVTRITGSNIDSAFGATMAQPKLVLFTDKEDTPGMFRALAASFRKYKLHFFTIHSSDKQALKQFSITKVPAVVLAYLLPEEAGSADGATKLQLQPFPGPLKYPYLAGWLTMAAQELNILPEGLQQSREGQDSPTAPTGAGTAVSEVSSSEAFREQCADTGGLCIIAALDATSGDYEAHKTVFQAAANSRANKALSYMWLDVASQHTFWAQLGVQRGDAPTAVALSPKKRRQGRLDAAGFTQAGLTDFVTRLVSGKLNTYPLQEIPAVIDGGEAPLPEEPELIEEFDLADILGEQLDEEVGTKEDRLRQLAEQEEEEATRRQQDSTETPKKKKKKSGKKKRRQSPEEL